MARRKLTFGARMFVGHYAAAFAAKAIEPKTPLWTLAAGCQLIDIGWSGLIIGGVEHASANPSLPGSTLVLYDMPWTHSLPGAAAWSVAAALLCLALLRLSALSSVLVGLVVFSHWLLDLVVHRPDLLLYPGGPKVGLALWNFPAPEQAVEMGLLAVFGAIWIASRKTQNRTAWPAIAFIAFLVVLQIAAMVMAPPAGPVGASAGAMALAIYLVVTAFAAWADGRPKTAA